MRYSNKIAQEELQLVQPTSFGAQEESDQVVVAKVLHNIRIAEREPVQLSQARRRGAGSKKEGITRTGLPHGVRSAGKCNIFDQGKLFPVRYLQKRPRDVIPRMRVTKEVGGSA